MNMCACRLELVWSDCVMCVRKCVRYERASMCAVLCEIES